LILFIIIIILYFDYLYFSNCNLDTLEMTEQDKDDVFKYLEYFINLLNEQDIIYWIIGGTTLGAVRHNDIVLWDNILVYLKTSKNV
jgi:phosphorylcholine metabolism protein LicD